MLFPCDDVIQTSFISSGNTYILKSVQKCRRRPIAEPTLATTLVTVCKLLIRKVFTNWYFVSVIKDQMTTSRYCRFWVLNYHLLHKILLSISTILWLSFLNIFYRSPVYFSWMKKYLSKNQNFIVTYDKNKCLPLLDMRLFRLGFYFITVGPETKWVLYTRNDLNYSICEIVGEKNITI